MQYDKLNDVIKLADGRKIGFADYGDPNGDPIFHFHGHGNSRFEGEMFRDSIEKLGVRFIVIDRPGYGLSDLVHRDLLNWHLDVEAVANHLEIGTFNIMGISGGAPHALACAFMIPDRIHKCAIISVIGPPGEASDTLTFTLKFNMFVARRWSWFYKKIINKQYTIQTNPISMKKMTLKYKKRLPKGDFDLLTNNEFLTIYSKMTLEGSRQGSDGAVQDAKAFCSPWGFDIRNILLGSKLTFWHGTHDHAYQQAIHLSTLIKGCKTQFIDGEGHVSIAVNHSYEILKSLIS